jgi:hypothetical protein
LGFWFSDCLTLELTSAETPIDNSQADRRVRFSDL